VQHHAADELDVEMAHAHRAPRCLPSHRERFGEQVVEGDPGLGAVPELVRLGPKRSVVESLHGRLERVHGLHHGEQPLDVALVLGAEDLLQERVEHAVLIIYVPQGAPARDRARSA
jgi:hypothetical protein